MIINGAYDDLTVQSSTNSINGKPNTRQSADIVTPARMSFKKEYQLRNREKNQKRTLQRLYFTYLQSDIFPQPLQPAFGGTSQLKTFFIWRAYTFEEENNLNYLQGLKIVNKYDFYIFQYSKIVRSKFANIVQHYLSIKPLFISPALYLI